MHDHSSSFSIHAAPLTCFCGGKWTRSFVTKYDKKIPKCQSCGAQPHGFYVQKLISRKIYKFWADRNGEAIETIEDCFKIDNSVGQDVATGSFRKEDYSAFASRRKHTTFGRMVLSFLINEDSGFLEDEEKEYVEEYLAPYFIDTPKHIAKFSDYVEDMGLTESIKRRPQLDFATKVYNKIVNHIGSIDPSEAVAV
jgi:hypothetical protein